jgi:hypothetical protein
VRTNLAQLGTLSGHRRVPAFGLAGGAPGALGRHWVERADGSATEMRGCDSVKLEPGDTFILEPRAAAASARLREPANPAVPVPPIAQSTCSIGTCQYPNTPPHD